MNSLLAFAAFVIGAHLAPVIIMREVEVWLQRFRRNGDPERRNDGGAERRSLAAKPPSARCPRATAGLTATSVLVSATAGMILVQVVVGAGLMPGWAWWNAPALVLAAIVLVAAGFDVIARAWPHQHRLSARLVVYAVMLGMPLACIAGGLWLVR